MPGCVCYLFAPFKKRFKCKFRILCKISIVRKNERCIDRIDHIILVDVAYCDIVIRYLGFTSIRCYIEYTDSGYVNC